MEHLSRQGTAKEAREIAPASRTARSRSSLEPTPYRAGADFADLALVIVDEEQRSGTAQKEALTRLRDGVHVLR